MRIRLKTAANSTAKFRKFSMENPPCAHNLTLPITPCLKGVKSTSGKIKISKIFKKLLGVVSLVSYDLLSI